MDNNYTSRGKCSVGWVTGSYFKHLPYTPYCMGKTPLEKEYKHLIVHEGFSDWGLPRDIAATEVDPNTVGRCTGLKDCTGQLIYRGDIIVIPNLYPFYDYKSEPHPSLKDTEGEIQGESVLNYVGIVEWVYSQWQYCLHCVNPNKSGISEGINEPLNYTGYSETENTPYKIIGNIWDNPELVEGYIQ